MTLALVFGSLFCPALVQRAHAQNIAVFTGTDSYEWNDPYNWLTSYNGVGDLPLAPNSTIDADLDGDIVNVDASDGNPSFSANVFIDGGMLGIALNDITTGTVGLTTTGFGDIDGGSVEFPASVLVTTPGAFWNISSDLLVGDASVGTLTISNGGNVTVGGPVYVGNQTTGNGTVLVTDSGSYLDLGANTLYVGDAGLGNLAVANGANISAGALEIGNQSIGNGTVLITDAGSLASISSGAAVVGEAGNGTLTIANGGNVTMGSSLTLGNQTTGNGTVLVTDTNSILNVTQNFTVGLNGTANLTVANGGTVNVNGYDGNEHSLIVGYQNGSAGTVLVTGANSTLNVERESFIDYGTGVAVGLAGNGSLTVANGGNVHISLFGGDDQSLFVGYQSGSYGTLLVTDTNSTLYVYQSTEVGYLGTGNLTVANGGYFTTGGNGLDLGGGGVSGNGSVLVTDANTILNVDGSITVGFVGNGTLSVVNGGNVTTSGAIYLGYQSNDFNSNGTVQVMDPNSTLNVGTDLQVGFGGPGNLTVATGGHVAVSGELAVGDYFSGASIYGVGNVLVMDNNSTIIVGSSIEVGLGLNSTGNLTVANGGSVSLGSGLVVGSANTSTGVVLVTDANSTLTMGDDSTVGGNGTGNLTVANGASAVDAGSLFLGESSAGNGTVLITDVNSTLSVSGVINVGVGNLGYLTVANGGNVTAGQGLDVGVVSAGNGTVLVTDAFSTLNAPAAIIVGDLGNGTLTVANGGVMNITDPDIFNNSLYVGNQGGSNGTVTVTDSGSILNVGNATSDWGALVVGVSGNGTLTVANGGVVNAIASEGNGKAVIVGSQAGSIGIVSVSDANSTLTITHNELLVGDAGSGTLTVANGGMVNADGNDGNGNAMTIGNQGNSTGSVLVTDSGSFLGSAGVLNVGVDGTGSLTIANGASVFVVNGVRVAANSDGNGTLVINSGGTLEIGGLNGLSIGAGNGSVILQGGIIQATSDLTVTANITLLDPVLPNVIDTNGSNATFSGVISGNGGLEKDSLGYLTLAANETYLGDTSVTNGTLVVDGSLGGNIGNATNLSGDFYVGAPADGLQIVNGASVYAGEVSFANQPNDYDGIIVMDPGSLLNAGESLTVGVNGYAHLLVYNGGNVTDGGTLEVGLASTSTGDVQVMDPTSTLNVAGVSYIGDGGLGYLTIANGAVVNAIGEDSNNVSVYVGGQAGSNGSLDVTDTGTTLNVGNTTSSTGGLVVGDAGNGTLTVANDGIVNVNGVNNLNTASLDVGNQSGSDGVVLVTGSSSTLNTLYNIDVGDAGTGSLTVDGGASAAISVTGGLYIGVQGSGNGTVLVTDTGSTLAFTEGDIQVGVAGNGSLTVANGGVVNGVDNLYVGGQSTGTGTVLLTDPGSALNVADSIIIGDNGSGTLTIDNGATFSATQGITLGNQSSGSGTIILNGGTLTIDGANGITVGLGSYGLYFGGGTLQVINNDWSTSLSATLVSETTSTLDTGSQNITWTGTFGGTGALTKIGAGILYLNDGNALESNTLNLDGGSVNFNDATAIRLGGLGGNVDFVLDNSTLAPIALTLGSESVDATYSGNLSGDGSLTMDGLNNETLAGNNTYTGDTNVLDGGLFVTGSIGNATQPSGDLYVGGNTANLTISGGGSIYAGEVSFGNNQNDTDSILVTDPGSLLDANESLTVGADNLYLGLYGSATLTVANGGNVTDAGPLEIGLNSDGNGTVVVTDANSTLSVAGPVVVGDAGIGNLTIANGATVVAVGESTFNTTIDLGVESTGTGTLLVTDSSTSLGEGGGSIVVGDAGTGNLTVANGGALTLYGADGNRDTLVVGNIDGATGSVTVTDLGTNVNVHTGGMIIGESGNGSLTVANGAVLNNYASDDSTASVIAGLSASSSSNSLYVQDANSYWNITGGPMILGWNGSAGLVISNGGTVNSGTTFLGFNANAFGSVTTTGPGSTWNINSGVMVVGQNGFGLVTISDGGTVNSYGTDGADIAAYIAAESGSNGNVTVTDTGSTWNVFSGAINIGQGGDASLNIYNGGVVSITGNNGSGSGSFGGDGADIALMVGKGYAGDDVLVSDPGSRLSVTNGAVIIGDNTDGQLTVQNIANVTISGNDSSGVGLYIGDNQGVNGTVTVTDVTGGFLATNPSQLNVRTGALVVGASGNGSLTVANGASVNVYGEDPNDIGAYIGYGGNSTSAVTVGGYASTHFFIFTVNLTSQLNVSTGALAVGYNGNGTLTAANGGCITISGSDPSGVGAYIGYGANSTGTITVTDVIPNLFGNQPTLLNVNNGAVVVGYNGTGTLSAVNGGNIHIAGDDNTGTGATGFGLYIGENANSTGSVTVAGVGYYSGDQSQLNVSNGSLAVGYDGNGTLTASGGGKVNVTGSDTNGIAAYVGYDANSTSSVTVTDVGFDINSSPYQSSLSIDDGALAVGYNGMGTLNIANGGYVTIEGEDSASIGLYVGENANSTGTVTVAGLEPNSSELSGLYVDTGALAVGYNGNGTLTVSGGGYAELFSYDNAGIGAYIGYGANSNSSVLVTDVGTDINFENYQSTLKLDTGALAVGYNGTGTLTVANGGQVLIYGNDGTGNGLYVGENANSLGNVSVSGVEPNSELVSNLTMNGGAAAIGYYGNGTLEVTAGGTVGLNGEDGNGIGAYIGYDANSTSSVTVSDVGADNVPNYYQSTLNVNDGALVVGYNGNGTLNVANGGFVTVAGDDNTGTGETGFGLYIGENVNSTGTVTVNGVESVNTFDQSGLNVTNGTMAVGYYGNGTLLVSGGGQVDVDGSNSNGISAYIGYDANSTSSVTITDTAPNDSSGLTFYQSELNVDGGALAVGYNGTGTLTIANGGAAYLYGNDGNGFGLYIGENANSTGSVTVTGVEPDSTDFSLLFISGGAAAVGYNGNGTLTVSNGALVALSGNDANGVGAYIGYTANSTSSITVTGMGEDINGNIYQSTLNVGVGALVVGYTGTGTLTVANGGTVDVSGNDLAGLGSGVGAYVGFSAGSNGSISVDGVGSVMNVTSGALVVGYGGAGNLSITNGGVVNLSGTDLNGFNNDSAGYFGFDTGYNDTVSVSDTGSSLNVTNGALVVATYGNGTLLVVNGGQANLSDGAILGFIGGSLGNLTVSDPGSSLNITTDALTVGDFGNGTLTVANGANVSITGVNSLGVSIVMARYPGAYGNVYVTDAGSTLNTSGSIQVGISGTGNFTVANGANVTVHGVDIASNALIVEGSNGAALVTDPNSTVTLTNGDLNLWGGGGSLTIANGGTLNAEGLDNQNSGANNGVGAYIGYTADALSVVTVTDANSTLAVTNGALVTGYDGTGVLDVVNGGTVNVSGRDANNAGMDVGFNSDGTGSLLVDGEGSSLDSGPLVVGDSGNGLLMITNGGNVTTTGADDANSLGAYIGWQHSSNGDVLVGTNATWTIQDAPLVVGYDGTGALNISNGGNVTANNGNGADQYAVYVGHDSGGVGAISVDGNGSELTANGGLVIGYNGTGTVDFTRDGELSVGTDSNNVSVTLGMNEGGSGTLKVDGSPLAPSSGNGSNSNGGGSNGGGSNGGGFNLALDITAGMQVYHNSFGFDIAAQDAIGGALQALSGFNTAVTDVTDSLSTSAPISTGPLVIGDSGNGSLLVVNGGNVITTGADDAHGFGAYIGWHGTSNSTAVVDGLGSTWNIQDAPLVVGNWGTGSLSITNGGNVTANNDDQNDANSLYVGRGSNGVGTVTVSDLLSLLTVNNGDLQVGYNGTGSLTVANGGEVYLEGNDTNGISAYLGYNAGSTGNVTVTDVEPNSGYQSYLEVDNGALVVGYNGNGTLAIANGGNVTLTGHDTASAGAYIGYGANANGTVTVDGIESNSGDASTLDVAGGVLVVGYNGNGTLIITNGGVVDANDADGAGNAVKIGAAVGSNGNVTVSDAGSALNVSTDFDLIVGDSGNGSLTVTNGGKVSTGYLVLANGSSGVGDVSITNGGLLQVSHLEGIAAGSGIYSFVLDGGTLQVGSSNLSTNISISLDNSYSLPDIIDTNGSNATLSGVLSGAGDLEKSGNGNLTLAASETYSGNTNVLEGALVVDGSLGGNIGSLGQPSGDLSVGAGNATLLINNGATVYAGNVSFGNSEFDNDQILVTDAGSILSTGGILTVGVNGAANLTIANGGAVNVLGYDEDTDDGLYVGYGSGSNGTILVTDANSTLTTSGGGYAVVGESGNGALTITNGASVDLAGMTLGDVRGSNGILTVNGTDGAGGISTLITDFLNVGLSGNGTLSITNGGKVVPGDVSVGALAHSNSTITVDGTDGSGTASNLSVTSLTVGGSGIGLVTVSNGGDIISSGALLLGSGSNGSGTVLVTDANSTLTVDGTVTVGYSSPGNLTVANGGNVTTDAFSFTLGFGGDNTGTVLVTDANSTLDFGNQLFVGTNGEGNLAVANGGNVSGHTIYIGHGASGFGEVLVTDANSTLSTTSDITVGDAHIGHLTVANGGNISDGGSLLLGAQSSGNGTVLITDANSTLSVASDVLVGQNGVGYLTVANGANITFSQLSIADGGSATGTVLVTDANSTLNLTGRFYVGSNGQGTLTVANGGKFNASGIDGGGYGLYVGYAAGSAGNLTVDGVNSNSLTASELDVSGGALVIGYDGNSSLTVSDGGVLRGTATNPFNNSIFTGFNSDSSGCLTVTGAGSTITEVDTSIIGYAGTSTMVVADGGNYTAGNDIYVAQDSPSNSSVSVSDTNSILNVGNELYLGDGGNGTLTIANGAVVKVNGGLILADQSGSNGTLAINSNGTLEVGGADGISAGAGNYSFTMDGGVIKAAGSDLTTALDIVTASNGNTDIIDTSGMNATFSGNISGSDVVEKLGLGNLTFTGNDTYAGGTTVNAGTLIVDGTDGGQLYQPNGDLVVSTANGTASFTAQNGATVEVGNLTVGLQHESGNVLVNESDLTVDGVLIVGDGHGDMLVNNYGQVYVNGVDDQGIAVYLGDDGGNSSGNLTIDDTSANLNVYNGAVVVGNNGTGNLTVDNDARARLFGADQYGISLYVGYNANSNGTVRVADAYTDLEIAGETVVGYGGNGSLTIANGALVNSNNEYSSDLGNNGVSAFMAASANTTGNVLVTDANSTWNINDGSLLMEADGSANLTIANGGTVNITGNNGSGTALDMAEDASVYITDANSTLNVTGGGVYVGNGGPATLTIVNGGNATFASQDSSGIGLYVGYAPDVNGTVLVDGVNSTLSVTNGTTIIGVSGNGSLTISNGGVVNSDNTPGDDVSVWMAQFTNSTADVLVTDANSTWNISNGSLLMDTGGSANLTIANGGTVNITGNDGSGEALVMTMAAADFADLTVTGAGSNLNITNGTVSLGEGGPANLTIANGGNATISGEDENNFTAYVGTQGQIYVTDANSTLITNNGAVEVEGGLTVANGGNATLTGSDGNIGLYIGYYEGDNGTVLVDGNTSSLSITGGALVVGYSGNGNLTIQNEGGSNNLNNVGVYGADYVEASLYIGENAGSNGTVTITDADSLMSISGSAYVGDSGNGVLLVTNGGTLNSYGHDANGVAFYVGETANGTGNFTVDGASTVNVNEGAMIVGDSGAGSLTITDGGTVMISGETSSNQSLIVANNANSIGTVLVADEGAFLMVADALTVGSSGTGNLTITNDGNVTANGGVLLAQNTGSNGTLAITAGGMLQVAGSLLAGNGNGSVTMDDGTIQAINSNLTANASITLNNSYAQPDIIATGTYTATFTGVLSGVGLLEKQGSGSLILGGNDTYTGGTTVSQGALLVDGALGGNLGNATESSGNLTVNGQGSLFQVTNGALTYVGNASFGNNLSDNDQIFVNDSGSVLSANGTMDVGVAANASANLAVANGGRVIAASLDVGEHSGSNGTVLVTDASSTLISAGGITVGDSGNGSLTVANGGNVTSGAGIIANHSSSNSSALVTGANSTWNLEANLLTVGSSGTGTLTISDGGNVADTGGAIVGDHSNSSGIVVVTDANSTLDLGAGTLFVGDIGGVGTGASGNLTIANGGNVTSGIGYLGDGGNTTGTALVTGANSTWNMGSNALYVGDGGSGNLAITNDGYVTSGEAILGNQSGGNGRMTVSSGSEFSDDGYFYIGYNGTGNLAISNGGMVFGVRGEVAEFSGSNGTVTVDGANSLLHFSTHFIVGDAATGSLTVSNGGAVTGGSGYLGYASGANGTALVTGTNSTWNLGTNDLYVGRAGTGSLTVSSGGNITSGEGFLGNLTGSSGTAVVTGANSTWNLGSNDLIVGDLGNGSLTISNGSNVTSGFGFLGDAAAGNGTALVTGANSTWNLGADNLLVGEDGRGNLTISNGGDVISHNGLVGYAASGASGAVLVTGANSTWNLGSALTVGYNGTGNLTIANSGNIVSGVGELGFQSGSNGTVLVTDADSIWNMATNDLIVGGSGTGNLTIANGGNATSGYSYVGEASGSNGTVLVTGANSTWSLGSYELFLGDSGNGSLTISNGGTVNSSYSSIGSFSGSNGTVLVTGANSTWDLGSNALDVGFNGTGSVTISNGGNISSGYVGVGYESTGSGTLLVTGANSTLTILGSNELTVGYLGTGNATIANGGTVTSSFGDVGGSASGMMLVTGANSTWSMGSTLFVGDGGTGNLTIANGGNVTSGYGVVGNNVGTNGTVLVTDANSTWDINVGGLFVGWNGTGNLTISNGGNVSSSVGGGVLGVESDSNGTVLVTDANSTWNLGSGALTVGANGAGSLTIANGGTVTSGQGYVGQESGSNGTVTVTGANSTWNLMGNILFMGDGGEGNLTISNGGSIASGLAEVGADSSGTVLVTDANSTWNLSGNALDVGLFGGTGNLTITNGGSVTSGSGDVGFDSGSSGTVLVTGANSTWNMGTGGLTVGESGTGNLTVANGGQVSVNAALILGDANSGNGALHITGENSFFKSILGDVVLGGYGAGVATADYGGTLDIMGGGLILGSETGSSGTFNLNTGGTLELAGGGITSGSGSYAMNLNGGTLQFNSNSTSTANFTLGDGTISSINTNNYTATVNGDIGSTGGGTGGVSVSGGGGGSLVLNGANTYTGTTSVTSGNLIINGQHASAITVTGVSAVLGGNGTINNSVTISGGGAISPGIQNSVAYTPVSHGTSGTASGLATLTVTGAINWDVTTTTLAWHLSSSSAAPTASDTLNVGTLINTGSKSATITFDFEDTGYFGGEPYGAYTLITAGNDLSQQFNLNQFEAANVWQNSAANLQSYFLFSAGGTELQFVVVPEPATWGLILGGAMLVAGWRRKRRKA